MALVDHQGSTFRNIIRIRTFPSVPFGITQGATTLSITTISIMTFSKTTQHNDIYHNNKLNTTLSIMAVLLCWMSFMLSFVYTECRKQTHYAECHDAECGYVVCRSPSPKSESIQTFEKIPLGVYLHPYNTKDYWDQGLYQQLFIFLVTYKLVWYARVFALGKPFQQCNETL
jgi:hypothetical protein